VESRRRRVQLALMLEAGVGSFVHKARASSIRDTPIVGRVLTGLSHQDFWHLISLRGSSSILLLSFSRLRRVRLNGSVIQHRIVLRVSSAPFVRVLVLIVGKQILLACGMLLLSNLDGWRPLLVLVTIKFFSEV